MNSILNGSRFQIRQTESEPVSNGNGSAGEFRYMLENGKVHFTPEERAAYLQMCIRDSAGTSSGGAKAPPRGS